jgi:competence protein ComEC
MNISFSIASIIAVIPHGIMLFHKIVLIAVFLNIVVVPIFSAALVLGIVFVILPIDIMRVCIAALIKSMIAAVILIAGRSVDIPIFSFNVAGSGVLFAAVVVMILIACVYIKGYKSKILLIIVLFIIILTNKVISQSYDKGVFQLIMFDVGAGESMLIKCPNGDKLIIDGGGSVYSNFDVGMKVLKQALLKIGVSRIDYAILTHEHPDHRRGLEYILREFKIKELWDSNCSNRNFACKNLMGIMKSNHILFSRLSEGNIIEVGNVKIKVLHSPLFNRSRKPNENSIVIMVEVYGRKLLLTGDIESKNEQELIKKYGKFLKADIIKVPHHGSKSSSTEEFLEQISPRIALLSVGNAEFLNLPNEEVIRRYINYRCELYRTDINGEIFVSIYPDGMIKINIFNE